MANEAIRAAPPLADALASRRQSIWFRIGSLWESMNDLSRAAAAYETVLRLNQSHVPAMVKAGVLRQRDHVPSSISYLATAVGLEPSNGPAWAHLAYSYIMAGDFDKAYHAYFNALSKQADRDDPALWHGIGILYDRLGLLDDAIACFVAVLGLAPSFEKSDEIYYALGVIYKEKGEYIAALTYLSKVTSLNSSPTALAEANYQIAVIHDLAGNTSCAVEAYSAALRSHSHVKAMQSFAWLKHKMGKSPEAVELLQRALQVDDSDGCSSYLLGRVYMANNEYRVAYDNYQRAVHLDGNNAHYWCSIAALYYQRQQHRDAMDAYIRAMDINSSLPEVWYDLGTLYETYNQYNDALNAYRHALDLQPQNRRFVERYSAIQHVMQSGVAPQPPSGKPASDDIHPIPSVVRRVRFKSDSRVRYGPLPPPPDAAAIQRRATTRLEHRNYPLTSANGSTGMTVAGKQEISELPMSGGLANGVSAMGGKPAISTGTVTGTPARFSSDAGVRSTSSALTAANHTRVDIVASSPAITSNGGQSIAQSLERQEHPTRGNPSQAPATGSPHAIRRPSGSQPSLSTSMRSRENPLGPVSPELKRSSFTSQDQALAGTRIRERSAGDGIGRVPVTSSRADSNTGSTPLPLQAKESAGAKDGSSREQPTGEDNTWRAHTERASAEAVTGSDLYATWPGVISRNADTNVNSQGQTLGALQRAAQPSMSNSVQGVDHETAANRENKHVSSGPRPNEGVRSPPAPSSLSGGKGPGEVPPKASEMQHSKAVPSNSVSTVPGKGTSGPGPATSMPRASTSDEPSRRSVSSSLDRTGRASLPAKDSMVESSRQGSPTTTNNRREQVAPVPDNLNVQNAGKSRSTLADGGEVFQSSLGLNSSQGNDKLDLMARRDKSSSPVDEAMLPRLPPLPSSGADVGGYGGPSEAEGNARGSGTQSKHLAPGAGITRDSIGASERRSGEAHPPLAAQGRTFSDHGAPPRNNALDTNVQSQPMLRPQVYRVSGELEAGRLANASVHEERFAHGGGEGRTERSLIAVSSQANGPTAQSRAGLDSAVEIRSSTALTASEQRKGLGSQSHGDVAVPIRSVPLPFGSKPIAVSQRDRQIPEEVSGPRYSSGHLDVNGRDAPNVSKTMDKYDAPAHVAVGQPSQKPGRGSDGGEVSGPPLRDMGGVSGGVPEGDKDVDGAMLRPGSRHVDPGPSRDEHGPGGSSIRNPFGSGAAPSFSNTLSRIGTGGALSFPPTKTTIPSDTAARTGTSEGVHLRSSLQDNRPQVKGNQHGPVSGLGKRTASAYESGSFKGGDRAEYGPFVPKPAVLGPSVGKQLVPQEDGAHGLRDEGPGKHFVHDRDNRSYGDDHRELKRGKPHGMREHYSSNRFDGGL